MYKKIKILYREKSGMTDSASRVRRDVDNDKNETFTRVKRKKQLTYCTWQYYIDFNYYSRRVVEVPNEATLVRAIFGS